MVSAMTDRPITLPSVERFIQERAVNEYWANVDLDLGARIARELGMSVPPIIAQGAGAEHDDLHRAR